MEYHPDKCSEDDEKECQSKFIQVTNAYEVLLDKEKRKKYNKCGAKCLKNDDGDGTGDPAEMFRRFYGREPDGKVRVQIFQDQWGRQNYQFTEEGEPGPDHNLFDGTDVEQLEETTLNAFVLHRDEPWVVLFYTPKSDDCRATQADYTQIGKTFKDIVKIGAINCFQHKDTCRGQKLEMRSASQPVIKWFPIGEGKEEEVFEGLVNSKLLGKWISSIMPDLTAVVKSKRELAAWAEEVAGRKPCVILLTDKSQPPPLWKALSREFSTRAALSTAVRCDKSGVFKTEVQKMMGMVTVPAVLALDPLDLKVTDTFNGPMKPDILKLWLQKQAMKQKSKGASAVFPQWTKERLEEGMCAPTDGQWCFVWIKSGKDTQAEEVMRKIADKYRTDPVKIVWVSAELSPEVLDSFGIEDFDDKVVAFRPKRRTFKIAPEGAHRDMGIFDSFVDSVMNGGPLSDKIKSPVRLEL